MLFVSQFLTQSGFPIYSIDVHPKGTRFVTGGGDSKIKFWSRAPLTSSIKQVRYSNADFCLEEEEKVKLLASRDHTSPVNCVKFNHSGSLVASAGRFVVVFFFAK